MKKIQLLTGCALIFLSFSVFSQTSSLIDLHAAVKTGKIQVVNRELTLITEKSYSGISLSKDFGEGVAWLKDIEFSNGVLEFDVRGEDLKQHSFVGIAFHGKDDSTFDAIYLRPFQFKAKDEILRNRSIQYISLPHFTWQVLRELSPGKYEHSIDPAPEPNSWVKVRVIISNSLISVYINNNLAPSLTVEKATQINGGKLGFYVADTSGGDFANLTITKSN